MQETLDQLDKMIQSLDKVMTITYFTIRQELDDIRAQLEYKQVKTVLPEPTITRKSRTPVTLLNRKLARYLYAAAHGKWCTGAAYDQKQALSHVSRLLNDITVSHQGKVSDKNIKKLKQLGVHGYDK